MKRLFVIILLITGCHVPALQYGDAAQKNAETSRLSAYTDYVLKMEKLNVEREVKGLQRRPILSRNEWEEGQIK